MQTLVLKKPMIDKRNHVADFKSRRVLENLQLYMRRAVRAKHDLFRHIAGRRRSAL
jgi:hypothetical protein